MSALPVIAIFDIGKTNKKLFLFDENYKIVFERSARFNDTADEDGFPCENLEALRLSVLDSLAEISRLKEFDIKAINFSTYGASFVHVDEDGNAVTPLYSYLKPYPEDLKKKFYETYGGEDEFSQVTASPVLGHLNSGMQLYWLKHRKPEVFRRIKFSLHLPQYISSLVTSQFYSDITSIGCHTNLWNFRKNNYHEWVYGEGIAEKLAPITSSDKVVTVSLNEKNIYTGIGLHDSSAALIPYLASFDKPFILISTGTWCISLNPFNNYPLTGEQLQSDCLSYLTYEGKVVKASRLFAGNDHEEQVKRIADHFNQNSDRYKTIVYDENTIVKLQKANSDTAAADIIELIKKSLFAKRDLAAFGTYEEAYHQLILDIITQQIASTKLIQEGTAVKQLFVDGGFSKNSIYMNLLASAFPEMEVFAASMAQATAVGAALAVNKAWNDKPVPNGLIELKYYPRTKELIL